MSEPTVREMSLVIARDLVERTPVESIKESYIKHLAAEIEDTYWYNELVDTYNEILQRYTRDSSGVGTGLG
jgi:hypothetical protein